MVQETRVKFDLAMTISVPADITSGPELMKKTTFLDSLKKALAKSFSSTGGLAAADIIITSIVFLMPSSQDDDRILLVASEGDRDTSSSHWIDSQGASEVKNFQRNLEGRGQEMLIESEIRVQLPAAVASVKTAFSPEKHAETRAKMAREISTEITSLADPDFELIKVDGFTKLSETVVQAEVRLAVGSGNGLGNATQKHKISRFYRDLDFSRIQNPQIKNVYAFLQKHKELTSKYMKNGK